MICGVNTRWADENNDTDRCLTPDATRVALDVLEVRGGTTNCQGIKSFLAGSWTHSQPVQRTLGTFALAAACCRHVTVVGGASRLGSSTAEARFMLAPQAG